MHDTKAKRDAFFKPPLEDFRIQGKVFTKKSPNLRVSLRISTAPKEPVENQHAYANLDDLTVAKPKLTRLHLQNQTEGESLWSLLFEDQPFVDWDGFVTAFRANQSFSASEEAELKKTLITNNLTYVTKQRFSDFMTAFGGKDNWIPNLMAVSPASWFYASSKDFCSPEALFEESSS